MQSLESPRIGYVVKRYPRYSETFIVNEILAHERSGLDLDIFALRPPADTHFQPAIARVRAEVHYLNDQGKMTDFWSLLEALDRAIPGCVESLMAFHGENIRVIFQGMQLAKAVSERGIKHLHAHFATSAASVARIAASVAGISYSFTAHAKDIFHESVEEEDLRLKLCDASSTITVSDFNVEFLKDQYGAEADRVVRIYNGLDLDLFPFEPPTNRQALVLAVGRLVEKKGFNDLIEACAILAGKGASFQCRIVGAGELAEPLQDLIARHNLANRVELMGPRPQSEIIELLREAAVFAAPCVVGEDGNRDGLPTVLLEAMALGTPCISTDVTGIPEILLHEKTGLLVSQKSPDNLAKAIARLLKDDSLRVRLAREARSLIEDRFDIHRNAKKIRGHFAPAETFGDGLPTQDIHLESTP